MSSDLRILRLALPSPLRRYFDYLPPVDEGSGPDTKSPAAYRPGQRFLVPFGRRELVGILIEIGDHSEYLDKLRPAIACLDVEPVWPAHLLELGIWAGGYYQHSIGDALMTLLPASLRRGDAATYRHHQVWLAVENPKAEINATARRQKELLDELRQHPQGMSAAGVKALGYSTTLLNALSDKGLVESVEQQNQPNTLIDPDDLLREGPLILNDEQHLAVSCVAAELGQFHCHLLQGVTGSGKTEVYLQLIEKVLKQSRQALVLVPEIGLTPQLVNRFRRRFNAPVAVMHSGLNDRERLDAWLMAKQGHAGVLIGTRSALLAPLASPGIIIIDEEHDGSFKQQDGFRYSARDLAVARARRESIPIVLGSATPSLESFHNARNGRYQWLKMDGRAGGAKPPIFELLDIRQESLDDGLSAQLIEQISQTLKRQEQVLVFLNRRGFAPILMCHDCGWQADCPQCDAHMTLHRRPAHLHCHHCDYQASLLTACPHCKSRNIKPVGIGTERTEETLGRLFPQAPVIRVDRDSTRRKDAMQKIIEQIDANDACILVGTQMLAKGHHFPKVTLVAILDADAGLFSADFRGMEKMAQLILQVAGRSGRSDRAGRVLMQTLNADHPRMRCLIEQGYTPFAIEELAERQAAVLPPFCHYALLRAEAVASGRAEAFLQMVKAMSEPWAKHSAAASLELLGPMPSPMEKRAGRFRAQLLIQSDQRKVLHGFCHQLLSILETNKQVSKQAAKVRWSLDIDPLDMF